MKELSNGLPDQTTLHEALQGLISLCGPPVAHAVTQLAQGAMATALIQLLASLKQGKLTVMVACKAIELCSAILGHLLPEHCRTVQCV